MQMSNHLMTTCLIRPSVARGLINFPSWEPDPVMQQRSPKQSLTCTLACIPPIKELLLDKQVPVNLKNHSLTRTVLIIGSMGIAPKTAVIYRHWQNKEPKRRIELLLEKVKVLFLKHDIQCLNRMIITCSYGLHHVRVVIKGKVHGVFYMKWTIDNATELGLKGLFRNRRNGSVEALFSGSLEKVQEMEQRCRSGPPDAIVTGLEVFPSTDDPETKLMQKHEFVNRDLKQRGEYQAACKH
ncbi:Acylphosphatase [Forsythia ovata]|uniref:Acylphosphatase n=1 Tax=Forsythia ovata TaxID=205694 RepID=A0ABD1WVC2_9LAMI